MQSQLLYFVPLCVATRLGCIKELIFPLPPIAEQRRIADILDRADAVRRKRQAAIALTEELLRSAFLEMFSEYLNSRHTLAFTDVSEVLVDCRNKTAPYVDEGIPLIRTTNFRDYRLDLSDLKYVTAATNAIWSSRYQTAPNDIVYAREAPFGMAAIVPEGFFPCLGQRIMVSHPNRNLVLPEYLLFALNSPFVYKQALEVAVGSTVKHLRVADVNQLRIPVPPMSLQEKFVTLRNQAEYSRFRQANQGKEGMEFFNALLQRAFQGKL
ncbi:MAG: restriction endonuclease subunit S [Leptolyngbyaceae cyanobacterium]